MEFLVSLDHSLFGLLNGSLTSSFFDWFMPFITDAKNWLPLIILVWLAMVCSGRAQLRVLALALVVSVGFTDLVCGKVIKKAVGRLRPCALAQQTGFNCRLLLPLKTSKSFPSNHAANTAAFATAMIVMCGLKAGWPFIIIAFLVGYSRVYVGVHFPLDVAAGWLIGTLLALAVCRVIRHRWPLPPAEECPPPPVQP
ncbi:MAG: phosphatase PAP2 family protein [Candidatus Riflebacteria bacterium HGW-Riflebacteria-2]|jgi:undecaprenyl-diphosphatase|nr:MAG: phosphatase PAP2 family protein [Candidatus Riflebacteria bacterium HGW-Riflebacteria-2]